MDFNGLMDDKNVVCQFADDFPTTTVMFVYADLFPRCLQHLSVPLWFQVPWQETPQMAPSSGSFTESCRKSMNVHEKTLIWSDMNWSKVNRKYIENVIENEYHQPQLTSESPQLHSRPGEECQVTCKVGKNSNQRSFTGFDLWLEWHWNGVWNCSMSHVSLNMSHVFANYIVVYCSSIPLMCIFRGFCWRVTFHSKTQMLKSARRPMWDRRQLPDVAAVNSDSSSGVQQIIRWISRSRATSSLDTNWCPLDDIINGSLDDIIRW